MKYSWRNMERYRNKYLDLMSKAGSIIVLDTETTGIGAKAKVIQFAAIRYKIKDNFSLEEDAAVNILINPGEKLSEKIVEITGISDEVLSYARTEEEEVDDIFSFLETADLHAIYNKPFDTRMLQGMAERCGRRMPVRPCLDVLDMARDCVSKADVENHKLSTILGHLYPEDQYTFHDAYEDVRATARVLENLMRRYRDYKRPEDKIQVTLNWASYNVNPHNKRMVRIKTNLSAGEYGDIFYNIETRSWSCAATRRAEKLFQRIDLVDLERQMMKKYAWKYKDVDDMDMLAKAMGEEKKKKKA